MSFDLLLKRYFVVLRLGLVSLIAFFQASGAMQLVGGAIVVTSAHATRALGALKVPTPTGKTPKSAKTLLMRNVFDSVTGPIALGSVESKSAEVQVDLTDPLAAPTCDGIKALIITESTDTSWSSAALQGLGEAAPKLRRIGDEVTGKRVAYIGFNPRPQSPAVWLMSGSSICQVLMFSRTVPTAPTPTPTAGTGGVREANSGKRAIAKVSSELASRIQKVDDNEFQIDRSVVERILSEPTGMMNLVRFVPDTNPDGKVLGLKLSGIRPDTLLGTLGLRNGDRLETINGFDMTNAEKALEAYLRLRTADNLKVQITRLGQPTTIEYKFK